MILFFIRLTRRFRVYYRSGQQWYRGRYISATFVVRFGPQCQLRDYHLAATRVQSRVRGNNLQVRILSAPIFRGKKNRVPVAHLYVWCLNEISKNCSTHYSYGCALCETGRRFLFFFIYIDKFIYLNLNKDILYIYIFIPLSYVGLRQIQFVWIKHGH